MVCDERGDIIPRKEAVRILMLDTRDEMAEALEAIPSDGYRKWVRFYMGDWVRKAGTLKALKEVLKP